ncbi:MAG: iron-containing alcohol dehydrogenase, partial [Clostridiales bacterium]|nr:iron-containing alcohol dehydrogenase [Clostridiales bacterium]
MGEFFVPTRVITGADCIKRRGAVLSAFGKRALIVTGRGSARANGSLADVCAALEANGQTYAVFDGVTPNPGADCAFAGAAAAARGGCDFVVAIGG